MVLDRISQAVEAGIGRNRSEAAENLIIRGSDNSNQTSSSPGQPGAATNVQLSH